MQTFPAGNSNSNDCKEFSGRLRLAHRRRLAVFCSCWSNMGVRRGQTFPSDIPRCRPWEIECADGLVLLSLSILTPTALKSWTAALRFLVFFSGPGRRDWRWTITFSEMYGKSSVSSWKGGRLFTKKQKIYPIRVRNGRLISYYVPRSRKDFKSQGGNMCTFII